MRLAHPLLALLTVTIGAQAIADTPKKKPKRPTAPKKDAVPPPETTPPPEPVEPPKTPTPAPPAASPTGGGGGTNGGSGNGSGGGVGDAKSDAPKEPKDEKPEAGPDVDSLRQEYLSLRDELFKSRARANAVASSLYSTRIQIKLTYTTARYYNPAKATIRLDGANIYDDTTGAIGGDDGVRFDGYVAPGRHLITFRVEATGKDDDTFTSTTENQIVVKAVAGKDLLVSAKAKDGGDIAYEWKKSEHGSYGLGLDVSVKTTARPKDEGGGAPAAPAKGKK